MYKICRLNLNGLISVDHQCSISKWKLVKWVRTQGFSLQWNCLRFKLRSPNSGIKPWNNFPYFISYFDCVYELYMNNKIMKNMHKTKRYIYKIPSFQNYSDVKTLKVKSNSAQEMIKFNPISHLLVIIVLLNLYNYWPFFYQKFCSLRPCIGVLTLCCQLDRSPVFLTSWTTILSILTLFKEPYISTATK